MNTTQKILFVTLIVTGITVWSYNGVMLIGVLPRAEETRLAWQPAPATAMPVLTDRSDTTRTPYVGDFRDPFAPVLRFAAPKPKAKPRSAARKPVVQKPPPKLTLMGILWSPKSPMATIQGPDGKTENLRIGMTIAGAAVAQIKSSHVIMRIGSQTFRLDPPGPRL